MLSSILLHILWAVGALLLFSIAVIVHEYGHFIFARKCGMKVDAFSIGFGPALWKKTVNGVTYRVGCIPFGGYVALPQLDPSSMDVVQGTNGEEGERESLKPVSPWVRMVVAFAGPLGNLVLAVVLAFVIFAIPSPDGFGGVGVTVGSVDNGGRAELAGIKAGDKFVSVNGNNVSFWNDVVIECHFGGNTNSGIAAVVERDGRNVKLVLPVERDASTGYYKLEGVYPRLECRVGQLIDGMPAAKAGLEPGDLITAIDGHELSSPGEMADIVAESDGRALELDVVRRTSGATEKLTLKPEFGEEQGRLLIGIVFAESEASIPQWMMYKRPWHQLRGDVHNIFRMLRALFAPKSKGEAGRAAKDMGGALTLFYIFWAQVQAGLLHSLAFLRFLCVNLAILNLLPLPILDGGHIVFALAEIVTRRKPSAKFVNAVSSVFAVLLIGLMLLLVYRDAIRLNRIRSMRSKAAVEAVEEPSAETEGADK